MAEPANAAAERAARTLSVSESRQLLRRLIDEAVATKSDAYLTVENNFRLHELAYLACESFGWEGDSRSQMKKLEGVALGALTFGDVIDYVKNQTGRTTSAGKQWNNPSYRFGQQLHDMLWVKVAGDADRLATAIYKALPSKAKGMLEDSFPPYDKLDLQRELRLRLVQAYIRHLVAQYSYLLSTRSKAQSDDHELA